MKNNNYTPLVSVVIPCYNAIPYLSEALDSIINQTYNNLEIICINDGSTDRTGDVLEKYAKKDSRIKIVHNKINLKLIASLNKGIKLATGEFIARMDADDISEPYRIKNQIEFLLRNPIIDIVSTGAQHISESGQLLTYSFPRNICFENTLFTSFLFRPIGHAELVGKTAVFKNNLFENKSYTLHTEDYELWTRLLRKGYKLANINDTPYKVRINSQSVSRKFSETQNQNFVSSAQMHFEHFFDQKIDRKAIQVLVNRMDRSISSKDWKMGMKALNQIENHFYTAIKHSDLEIKKEFKTIYHTHIFDIGFQALKRAKYGIKFRALLLLLTNIQMIFNPRVISYVRNKIYKR